jgi:hypothetical protein
MVVDGVGNPGGALAPLSQATSRPNAQMSALCADVGNAVRATTTERQTLPASAVGGEGNFPSVAGAGKGLKEARRRHAVRL